MTTLWDYILMVGMDTMAKTGEVVFKVKSPKRRYIYVTTSIINRGT